jgi:ketosteroid isomerase-like protein
VPPGPAGRQPTAGRRWAVRRRHPPTLPAVFEETARQLLRDWWDRVWGEGDVAALDELITDPYIRHGVSGTEVLRRGDYKAKLVQYQRVLHRPVTTVDDSAVAGDRIWIRATSRGLNLETGMPSVMTWIGVHRIEDGRLAESWLTALPNVDWER